MPGLRRARDVREAGTLGHGAVRAVRATLRDLKTCKSIAERLEGLDLAAFAASEFVQDAIRMELLCLGHAAACQTPASRARLPGIGWERLEQFKEAKAVKGIPVEELWRFAIEEAPELGRKLR